MFIDNEIAQLRIKKAMSDARKNGTDEVIAMRNELRQIRKEQRMSKVRQKLNVLDDIEAKSLDNWEYEDVYREEPVAVTSSPFTDPNFSSDMMSAMSSVITAALSGANNKLTDPDLFRSHLRFDMDGMHNTLKEILNELRRR